MRFIGIDPSLSRTGLCICSDAGVEVYSISPSKKLTVLERQLVMVTGACAKLKKGDIVALEDFGVSSRFAPSGRFVERIEICGMLKMLLSTVTGLPGFSIPPNLLKSFVAGKASAKKTDVVAAVRERWKIDVNNDDEADAFGLARYAKAVFENDHRHSRNIQKFLDFSDNRAAMHKVKFLHGCFAS